jgi:hypothetical protein
MNRVFVGLTPFLLLVGALAYAAIAAQIVEHYDLQSDRAAIPYLKATNYSRPEGCPSAWNGIGEMPSACADRHYKIKSKGVARQFGLPPKQKGMDGWYRIGQDAYDLKCWTDTCEVGWVRRDVFGH